MKSEFSSSWISSIQPRKQHKYRHNAPLHIKHKFLSAHLSKELRLKYAKRSLPLRKGDEVLVMRGGFKKKQAKVLSVNLKRSTAYLENLQRTKKDGSKVQVPFDPRVLKIISINETDKERIAALNRKAPQKQISEKPKVAEKKIKSEKK